MMILSNNLVEAQICAVDTGAEWIDPDLIQNNIRATGLAVRCTQVQSQLLFVFIIFNDLFPPDLMSDA